MPDHIADFTPMLNDEAVVTLPDNNGTSYDDDENYVTENPSPPFQNNTLTFDPQHTVELPFAISTDTLQFHVITKRDTEPTTTPLTDVVSELFYHIATINFVDYIYC